MDFRMFGISSTEFLLIALLAFLFIGPERLVSSSHSLGKWVRKIKDTLGEVKAKNLSEVDTTALYQAQVEFNKTLEEISITRDINPLSSSSRGPKGRGDPV